VVLLVFLVIGAPGCARRAGSGKHRNDQLVHHASPLSGTMPGRFQRHSRLPMLQAYRRASRVGGAMHHTAAVQRSRNQASRRRRAQGGETARSEPRIRALQDTCSDGTRLWVGRTGRQGGTPPPGQTPPPVARSRAAPAGAGTGIPTRRPRTQGACTGHSGRFAQGEHRKKEGDKERK